MGIKNIVDEAKRLNLQNNIDDRLSPLIFLTERKRFKNIFETLQSIPSQTLVIIRDYDLSPLERLKYSQKIIGVCRKRGIKVLVGKDPLLARSLQADGLHIPEKLLKPLSNWRQKEPGWLFTTSCHSRRGLERIQNTQIDAVLLSPIFPTQSHPNSKTLGSEILKEMSLISTLPIYALGGINESNIKDIRQANIVGVAGIEMFN